MSKKRAKDRMKPEVNAGSMADIAFLLLIFFLVTTTIDVDKGVLVKLPPWSNEPPPEMKMNTRNVYSVLVNANNELLVRGEPASLRTLRDNTKEFIMNPRRLDNMAQDPTKAIISLKNDRGTNYKTYLEVYNELKAAYNELREEEAQKKYGKSFAFLEKGQQREIRSRIPLVISEAEPTDFGEEN
ncbi:MAG: biopolymer transporter ExbD [Saprospiraceae bacterium]|nr:biopolymer transporter ExbD [Bacteroidia bacterium]NNE15122.1 biopolymer transporter ExbD [Saprospiraceae bacterium]NNL91762.1 biopolymer transporter ExbD [Saprospiraceae bacterium]